MKKFFLLFLILFFFPLTKVFAQEEVSYKGVVQESMQVPCSDVLEDGYNCFEYVVYIPELDSTEKSIPMLAETDTPKFKEGDKVYITSVSDEFDNEVWSITGYNRNTSIFYIDSTICSTFNCNRWEIGCWFFNKFCTYNIFGC